MVAYHHAGFRRKTATAGSRRRRCIRISGTRVQLETIVLAFDAGATAEEITQQYTSVELADVYAVISYLLSNEAAVRDYVATRVDSAQALRTVIEGSMPNDGIRQRLLARRQQASGM